MRLCTLLALLLTSFFLTGCQVKPVPTNVALPKVEAPLTDAQKFSLLDGEAKRRNLRYTIFCTTTFHGGVEEYQADAEHIEARPSAVYVDQGRMDEWMENGKTQADAAYALYLSIQGPPTHLARDRFVRPPWMETAHLQCKRDIEGNWQYKEPK